MSWYGSAYAYSSYWPNAYYSAGSAHITAPAWNQAMIGGYGQGHVQQQSMYTYPAGFSSVRPTQQVQKVAPVRAQGVVWKNQLKDLFHQRQAITYALHLRTFAAMDKDGDGKIDPLKGENGTFLKAIPLLKELKAMGVNNIHLLPIMPVGKIDRLGTYQAPGSVYSPAAYDRLNEEYDEPGNNLTVEEEARMFIDEAHRLGIHVMADIPSCASVDMAKQYRHRPDIMAQDENGNLLTPTNWTDIRVFVKDSPALRQIYQGYFDLMVNRLGVDGFRADIARARTPEFWTHFISKYPDKAWLAETYTEEDASPLKNLPRDVPEDLLKAGFDAIYGQFHIFHDMTGPQYMEYMTQNQRMLNRVGSQKSIIGSFLTHDDPSTMTQGGALYCMLITGLMATQPDTNPYILDGFTTGFSKHFDIFNWAKRPEGKHPEIGEYVKKMFKLRQSATYGPVLTKGQFIPLKTEQNNRDAKVVAFLRQYQGKTLLVVANKDVNAVQEASIVIPGIREGQKLKNLAPGLEEFPTLGSYSAFVVTDGKLKTTLGPGRFYVFELDREPGK